MPANMQSFQWKGINSQGRRVEGVLNVADVKDVHAELKKRGIDVISVARKNAFQLPQLKFFSGNRKVTQKDILLFTRFLSTMLAAGLPIVQALDLIAQDQENKTMKSLLVTIKSNIAEGKTLAESFSQYPEYFGDLYCNLIKSGEKSGTLDKTLVRLGNYIERSENLKRKIKKALMYPIAILSVALIVSLILLIFVVPQFQKMFESFGAQLPLFTRMVVSLSNFLRGYWWLLMGGIIGLVWYVKFTIKHSEALRLKIDKLVLRLYIIGVVTQKGIIARYARTMATTLEAGMPIVEAMKAMAPIMGNQVYGKAILQISSDVLSGNSLSSSMASTKLFPNMCIQMIAVGEASGKLSDMLIKVAETYEEDVNTVVDNLSSLLEPVIMLILGVVVGGFVVAMYLPIFKMGSLF